MSLTDSFKQNFLKKKIKPTDRRSQIILKKPEAFSKILIIAEKLDEEMMQQIGKVFSHAEINCCSLRKEKEDQSGKFRYTVHPSDFNLTGRLKNDKLTKLQSIQFDLTIDLSGDSDLLKYFLCTTKSSLIIGKMEHFESALYDIFLDAGQNNLQFIANIEKQLNQLQQYANK
ncbi:MAG: hypothetical protein IPM74_05250 [Crocinitomicaceae bacterium]|nr:hypothetical protein [Crocinitomicaceae bacterium]MBK8925310.1 hypothetical protein [Crocinitomicaceae bacterium]